MKRLLLIIACHLSIYLAFAVCDWDNPIADTFDLRRHNGFYLTMALFCLMVMTPVDKYEDLVTFLTIVFIEGVLVNCIIFNITGDRDFHWYSVALVFLSFGHAFKRAWPEKYLQIVSRIPGYNLWIKAQNWLCRITK